MARHKDGGALDLREYTISPARLWTGEQAFDGPLAVIDLSQAADWPDDISLPACPVIGVGVGAGEARGSDRLDAVVEAPVTLEQLVAQVLANPRAAGAIVQLLRVLPSLSLESGLVVESQAYAMLQGSDEHRKWRTQRGEGARAIMPEGRVEMTRDGADLSLVLDRQEAGNAIDRTMRDALFEGLLMAAIDPDVERVLITARGRTFSLGADLDEFGTTLDPATAHMIRAQSLPARMAARCADKLEVHVQGGCVGAGLELAAYARRITASRTAWFQLPELAMGILPGAGGCVSLTRRIGRQRAALLILSGRRLSARRALDWGLVDAIVDHASADGGEDDVC